MSRFPEPFFPEENYASGPSYDVEDIGCTCWNEGLESEWIWNVKEQCYICNGCGEMQ